MSTKPLSIGTMFGRDQVAQHIAFTWDSYNRQRQEQIALWKELRNYIFATDTTTTTNKSLPWKNSTTLPKLCQIRDNLHSNYVSALFPNDDWLKWESYSPSDGMAKKKKAITAYMSNKTRMGGFRTEISKLLYDYIDYGNAFAYVDYESSSKIDDNGDRSPIYQGPKVYRISPLDIVFNPLASDFTKSFKIVRSVKTVADLVAMSQDNPGNKFLANALENRKKMLTGTSNMSMEDADKADGFMVDGFGDYFEYLRSGYVELLTFYGDIYNEATSELQRNRIITVADRMWVIDNKAIPSWLGVAPIYHVGWRTRPDNLWSMGPLENLIGIQYRIDHLENLKADAMDLAVLPPLVIKGDVEEFEYAPNAEIHIDENGDVTELARGAQWVITAENNIDKLEMRMEQYAGAPREAMGIRSAGEKTAFEIQQLQNAAGRIFQEKITTFEIQLEEPVLNAMLEVARRQMDATDIVRVIDDDLGTEDFMTITKEDITASGVLRPIGARHFAAQAQLVQNLTQLSNTPVWQQIGPHISSKNLAALVEDVLGLTRYQLFTPNVAVFEQQETARLANQAGEDLQVEQSMDLPLQ